ncbi:MAG: hypothetical protein EOP87_15980 [Verrucomicrobiaceae bacterium]|nr:MAG: hypothetical protein EOP87_15980 [Verrucomicrobiaceae bacterium]
MKTHLIALFLALAFSAISGAQTAAEWLVKAEASEKKGDSRAALAAYQEADRLNPDRAATLVKIAKQYGDLMTETKDAGERKKLGFQSLFYSQKAFSADDGSADAHLSVAISLGKLAEFMGNKEKIGKSREIKMHADRALRLDPDSDYAHHMLGRWHQELAGMGGATRALAKIIYGGLPSASFQEALDHFAKARGLRPDRLIHHIEYGRTLAMMGRKDDARTELKMSLAKPSRDKDDAKAKERGQRTLDDL